MLKVVLVDLFNKGTFGHRCLSSLLKQRGFTVYNVFGYSHLQYGQILTEKQVLSLTSLISKLKPDLVGFSMASILAHGSYVKLAQSIKKTNTLPIIAGGPYPSISPEFLIKEPCIDYVCVGEGEGSFLEFCDALSAHKSLEAIPGILSKCSDSCLQRDPPQDLDLLPAQDMTGKNTYYIKRSGKILPEDPFLHTDEYQTKCSRGCPYQCAYCCNKKIGNLYSRRCRYYRVRSVTPIIEEIKEYKKKNPKVKKVFFMDDTFPSSIPWLEEFSRQYREQVALPFRIWINPNSMTKEGVLLLKKAGLSLAMMGIQSALDATRKSVFCRVETRERILDNDRFLSENGIQKQYDFIIDHPWEDAHELQGMFDLILECKKPIYSINMHSLMLFPGTDLEERAVREGVIDRAANAEAMIRQPIAMSRRAQWVPGIPIGRSYDKERKYWARVIYLSQWNNPLAWRCMEILARPAFVAKVGFFLPFLAAAKFAQDGIRIIRKLMTLPGIFV
jgi:radical SAM superfamily enzyme YgiQ (UPF0313 family)